MKTHATAKELAGLPGMPGTEQAVNAKSKRESWPSQKRAGRGGGREYLITSLPAETRQYLASRDIVPAAREAAPVPALTTPAQRPVPAGLKQWQRDIMDARVGIMRLIERAAPAVGVNQAINTIVTASISGQLPEYAAANARRGSARALSYSGVMKWWIAWKNSGQSPPALAPKDVENYLEPAWSDALLQCWGKPQKPALTSVLEDLAASIPPGVPMPSYSQARTYLNKRLGAVEREKGRRSGKELRAIQPFRRRDTSGMYPGDAYTADGHCYDAEVAHPYHGRPFRPEITPVLDIATRRAVGWSCDLAESGLAVLDALRIACETFGPPAIFYTDNGSGYKNQMMTAPGTGILARLGITPAYSRPRNPQAHGLSERAHQTILVKAAKQLCTYIGSTMDGDQARLAHKETRKAIAQGAESPLLLEWDDFVAQVNAALERYNNASHRGLPALRDPVSKKRVHMTPNQAWELGIQQMRRDLPETEWLQPANELPDLYHPAIERTVNRGEIQFGVLSTGLPKRYASADLKEWHGHRVQVAYSPADASRVWVRDLEHGRLLAVAQLAGNADHYFAPTRIEEARIKRGKGRLKRLENQAEEVRLEMQGPAAQIIIEHPPEIDQDRQRLIETANVVEIWEPPIGDVESLRCWQALDNRINAGETLPEYQARWYASWQNSHMWKAWRSLQDDLEQAQEPKLTVIK